MREFKLPCTWTVCGVMTVKAETLDEAIDKAYQDNHLPDDSDYLPDSFGVNVEDAQKMNGLEAQNG
jgi:hypothetical protein